MTNDAPGPEKFTHVNWETAPNQKMVLGLQMYLQTGRLPGDFLQALISNNLFDAMVRADDTNHGLLREWSQWMHCEFPPQAWGSREKMLAYSEAFEVGHEHDVDWFGTTRILDHDGLNTDVLAFKCRNGGCDMQGYYHINVAIDDAMLEWM